MQTTLNVRRKHWSTLARHSSTATVYYIHFRGCHTTAPPTELYTITDIVTLLAFEIASVQLSYKSHCSHVSVSA